MGNVIKKLLRGFFLGVLLFIGALLLAPTLAFGAFLGWLVKEGEK